MAYDVNDACSLQARKEKAKRAEGIKYTDELAEFFAAEEGIKPRPSETVSEQDENGAFVRQANYFIDPITKEEAETRKYVIFWAPGCNWSERPVIARDLVGLENVIEDYIVGPTGESRVYGHGFPREPFFKDKYTGVRFLSTLYKNADPNYEGRATTPTLVDIEAKKARSSDYHRLSNHIEVAFRALQPKDAPDLYPVKYRDVIDEFNDWLFPHINNARYRQAFSNNPYVVDEAHDDFHKNLELLNKRLETNRFIFGDYITDSDIRAYVSLTKWEVGVYAIVGPQKKRIREYEHIWGYLKDLYTNVPAFKKYLQRVKLNPGRKPGDKLTYPEKNVYRDYDEWLKADGSRKLLSSDPENVYLHHPKGETVEDYIKPVSKSRWNDKDPKVRGNWHVDLKTDPSINPLKGLLKNE